MEFRFLVNENIVKVVGSRVLKVDHTLKAQGCEGHADLNHKMGFIINEMGKLSATAQKIKVPITSADNLKNSDQVLYLMTEYDTSERFSVVGFLKIGWKKLSLHNKDGFQLPESMVNSLLDIYIHESKQHKGYGKKLIDYMLQDIGKQAHHLAFDNPTKNLLHFMSKHYQLSKMVKQENNLVIFEEFFDHPAEHKNYNNGENGATSYSCPETFGRHGAHKHHDTMGGIIQGNTDADFVKHDNVHASD